MINPNRPTGKTSLSVKDGKFCINGVPEKLIGWNITLWDEEKDQNKLSAQLKVLSQYGFNAIRLTSEFSAPCSLMASGKLLKMGGEKPGPKLSL